MRERVIFYVSALGIATGLVTGVPATGRRVWAIFVGLALLGAGRRSVHRASVAAAAILIGVCTGARAGTGPCKPDQFNGLTCGEGPGAPRVIEGTMSPSKQIAFAWREPGKPPTEEPDIYQVESMLLWLYSGTPLAISPGAYWDTGTAHANRYDFHAIWSPNSRYVIELLDFRWSTEALRVYSLGGMECCRSISSRSWSAPSATSCARS